MKKQRGLGKGLDLIFAENSSENGNEAVTISINDIEPNRAQPRHEFNEEALQELADSIAAHGILQPILLRPFPDGGYQIVAGERRWRAARIAGLREVPAVIREMTEQEVMELALIENLQREDLDPVEIAYGYKSLMESFNLTQDEISQKLSIPRSSIANSLRILNLPEDILEMIKTDEISLGHAKVILSVSDEKMQRELAQQTAEKQLSVRQCELLAKSMVKKPKTEKQSKVPSIVKEVEIALSEMHGTPVRISYKDGKGTLNITFNSQEQLLELANLLEKK